MAVFTPQDNGFIEEVSRNPDVGLYVATNQAHDRARYLWDAVLVYDSKDIMEHPLIQKYEGVS